MGWLGRTPCADASKPCAGRKPCVPTIPDWRSMTITYDTATNIGKTRMLIPDRDLTDAVFQDVEIQAFLDLNDASVRRAAAEALETIASDQAMTLKVIRLLDLSTDGRAVSQALLERAARLREAAGQAEEGEIGRAHV